MVDCGSLALAVGAVSAVVAVNGSAFIKIDIVKFQGVDQHLNCAGNFPLGIGVLHPEKQHAAGLVGHPLGNGALHQVAQMDKAGGGGGHPGYNRALGQAALGKTRFQFLRRCGYVGEEQFGKRLIIHSHLPLFHCNLILKSIAYYV